MDYGKMAATFLNLSTGKAVRVIAKEESRQKAKELFPDIRNKYEAQIEAYKIMSDDELFSLSEVNVRISPEDMPGKPAYRVKCETCREYVQDAREVSHKGKVFCKACAEGSYYQEAKTVIAETIFQG
jgi:formylmethanofuran dehydrogenase subunit E